MDRGADAREDGGVLAIAGALTIQRAGEVKALLADALARADRVAIDLSGVTEVDLCGLQLLCAAQRTASRAQKRLDPAGPAPDVFRRAALEAGVCVRSGCGADDSGGCPWKGGEE